jgi:predicted flap endonuclease-1-like 5' DNA nuclease
MRWTWDKFGFELHCTPPQPVAEAEPERKLAPSDPVSQVLLQCLHLGHIEGVQVHFYEAIGKAVVLVPAKEVNPTWHEISDATRQSGWNVEVFAAARFERLRRLAFNDFNAIDCVGPQLALRLVDHGFFTLQELAQVDPKVLMRLGELDGAQADEIIQQAVIHAEQMEI